MRCRRARKGGRVGGGLAGVEGDAGPEAARLQQPARPRPTQHVPAAPRACRLEPHWPAPPPSPIWDHTSPASAPGPPSHRPYPQNIEKTAIAMAASAAAARSPSVMKDTEVEKLSFITQQVPAPHPHRPPPPNPAPPAARLASPTPRLPTPPPLRAASPRAPACGVRRTGFGPARRGT